MVSPYLKVLYDLTRYTLLLSKQQNEYSQFQNLS